MSELIVVVYSGKHKAAEVLAQLQERQDEWAIELEDAVAAYRRFNGRVRIETGLNFGAGAQAGYAGAFGLMIGAILAIPFTGGASAGVAAAVIGASAAVGGTAAAVIGAEDAFDWKGRFGLSDDFVKDVAHMIQPGHSALFALIRSSDPDAAVAHIAQYGGKLVRTTVEARTPERVEEVLREARGR